jgi:Ca2+-binding EF-hand superfamily protein
MSKSCAMQRLDRGTLKNTLASGIQVQDVSDLMFDVFDASGDGVVQQDELTQGIEPMDGNCVGSSRNPNRHT